MIEVKYDMPPEKEVTDYLHRINTQYNEMRMQVAETEDAFIFRTIKPFLEEHNSTVIEISKAELLEALRIIHLRREAKKTHGAYFSELCDLTSATATDRMLHDAYIRGVQHGKDSMYETMMSKFKEMENG